MTVEQMTDDDYFAFDAVDQTALKKYLVSPLAYSQYLTGEHSSSPSCSFNVSAYMALPSLVRRLGFASTSGPLPNMRL